MTIRRLLALLLLLTACAPTTGPLDPARDDRPTAVSATATPFPPPPQPSPTPTPWPGTPTPPPIPYPTPLNPATDMASWPWYRNDALGVAIQHWRDWRPAPDDSGVTLINASDMASATIAVTLAAYPNLDGLLLRDVIAQVWGSAAAVVTLTTAQYGPHLAHRTTDLPIAGGALTAFFEADGRFLAISLTPYTTDAPPPSQLSAEQLFNGMLATLQIGPPGAPTPAPLPGLTTGSSRSPVISADGRFVAFLSDGPLTADAPGGVTNVFIRDTATGVTRLVSKDVDGRALKSGASGMTMSVNGQIVAYYSFAGNIVLDDEQACGTAEFPQSREDLFVVDTQTGAAERIPIGRPLGIGGNNSLALSADGRFVAYGHDDNLWLYDRVTQATEPLLTGVNGGGPNEAVFAPRFANDGRTLAFVTRASNLLVNDINDAYDVFVLDLETGNVRRVSVTSDGHEADGNSGVLLLFEWAPDESVAISADGRFISFASLARNLSPDAVATCIANELPHQPERPCLNLYLHDRVTGETRLITPQSDGDSDGPALSADGRFLAFTSSATTLSPYAAPCPGGGPAGCPAVYLYDRELGTSTLLSVGPNMAVANAPSGDAGLSADGRTLVFASAAGNLVPGDTNDAWDVFHLDRQTAQLALISLANP